MISKELLSEVLEINNINLILKNENEINYTQYASISKGAIDNYINIYELAHKCKEWATSKDFNVTSKITKKINGSRVRAIATARRDKDKSEFKIYSSNTEPESIFKACQWILDNKEIK